MREGDVIRVTGVLTMEPHAAHSHFDGTSIGRIIGKGVVEGTWVIEVFAGHDTPCVWVVAPEDIEPYRTPVSLRVPVGARSTRIRSGAWGTTREALEHLRYVHGGDLHVHDWRCHA